MKLQTYEKELLIHLKQLPMRVYSLPHIYPYLKNLGEPKQIQLGLRSLIDSQELVRIRRGLYAPQDTAIMDVIHALMPLDGCVLGTWGFHLLKYLPEPQDTDIVYASRTRLRCWQYQNYTARYAFLPQLKVYTPEAIFVWSWNLGIGDKDELLKVYPQLDQYSLIQATNTANKPLWTARMGFLAAHEKGLPELYKKSLGKGNTTTTWHPKINKTTKYDPMWKIHY